MHFIQTHDRYLGSDAQDGINSFIDTSQDELERYFDCLDENVESKSTKTTRKAALTFLLNKCWKLNLDFAQFSTKGHSKAIKREHTAWTQEEREKLGEFAKENNYEMYALIKILFDIAGRIQDAVVFKFSDITKLRRRHGNE